MNLIERQNLRIDHIWKIELLGIMNEQAVEILMDWLNKVNSGDLEGVLALYDEQAVLLPTFSSEIRSDPDGIRRYFEKISAFDKVVVEVDTGSIVVQSITQGIHSIGGIYSWSLAKAGDETKFLARFTYTIDINSSSPILHHHSSLVPED